MPILRSAGNKVRPPARPVPRRAGGTVESSATYDLGPSCILFAVLRIFAAVRIAPEHDEDHAAQNQHGGGSGQAHYISDNSAVTSGFRIVFTAVQQHRIDYISNFVL